MIYLLDSNSCIIYLNGRSENLRRKLEMQTATDIAVCSVVKAELFSGARKSQNPDRSLAKQREFFSRFVSLPFNDATAEVYGQIRSDLERLGTPIGPYDLQIAAIALVNNLILVTHNTAEFIRVPNLNLEDWQEEV